MTHCCTCTCINYTDHYKFSDSNILCVCLTERRTHLSSPPFPQKLLHKTCMPQIWMQSGKNFCINSHAVWPPVVALLASYPMVPWPQTPTHFTELPTEFVYCLFASTTCTAVAAHLLMLPHWTWRTTFSHARHTGSIFWTPKRKASTPTGLISKITRAGRCG